VKIKFRIPMVTSHRRRTGEMTLAKVGLDIEAGAEASPVSAARTHSAKDAGARGEVMQMQTAGRGRYPRNGGDLVADSPGERTKPAMLRVDIDHDDAGAWRLFPGAHRPLRLWKLALPAEHQLGVGASAVEPIGEDRRSAARIRTARTDRPVPIEDVLGQLRIELGQCRCPQPGRPKRSSSWRARRPG